jgi:hypothetical protein
VENFRGHDRRSNKNVLNENVSKVEQKKLVASLRVSKWRPIGRTCSGHPVFYLMLHCGGGCPRYAGIAIPPIPFRAILV